MPEGGFVTANRDAGEPDYWIDRWQEGRTGFHRDRPHPWLIEFGAAHGIREGARVLVPLSGKSLDLLWIESTGAEVVAIEVARDAVDAFHRENTREAREIERAPYGVAIESGGITTWVADFFAVPSDVLGTFDVIYDRAALIALPAGLRPRYASRLVELLAPDGVILAITIDYPQSEMDGPPFSVPDSEVRALFPELRHDRVAEEDVLAREDRWRDRLSRLSERCARLGRGRG